MRVIGLDDEKGGKIERDGIGRSLLSILRKQKRFSG